MASSGEFRSCRSGRSQIPPSPTLLPRVSLTGAHGQKADAASPFVCTGFTSGRDFMDRDGLGMTRSALRTVYRDLHLALSPAFRLRASEWSPARRPSPRSAGPALSPRLPDGELRWTGAGGDPRVRNRRRISGRLVVCWTRTCAPAGRRVSESALNLSLWASR